MSPRLSRLLLPGLSALLVAAGLYVGLVWAPTERMMGDVYRIMFVHVPAAWLALVAYTVNVVGCIVYLLRDDRRCDALAEAAAEVGVVLNAIAIVTGSIWGRPTWGVWWTWEPRLTSVTIMIFSYAGYLALRAFVDEPERRQNLAAVVGIVAYVGIPLTWFSVRMWNTLHQMQSSPATMAPPMVLALRLNAFAFLAIFVWFVSLRYRVARLRQVHEFAEGEP
ncbi:MAG: transcriptional regulator [Deltaproteobacteria bacterium]|nr:MAG: transcriptional regulator [Deltaproteobacteria bacterium]